MAEAINASFDSEHTGHTQVDWGRAVFAGLIATIAITISMAAFGNNILKNLGMMMMGAGAGTMVQYGVGAVVHLLIGIVYGLIYAVLFAPLRGWGALLKGAVFGAVITAIALVAMPVLGAMMGGGGVANPCNPCGVKSGAAANPCNPCAAPSQATQNPCNPCAAPSRAAQNPCNPCAPKPGNPCAAGGAANPCNPCNPCGGGSSPYAGMISLINHLVYGFVLAFAYKPATS